MSLARRGASSAKKKTKRYRHKAGWKNAAKKAALGTAAGLAVSIPLTLLARHTNQPALMELGQRGGAVAATLIGGPVGEVGYQAGDALFDRFVVYQGSGISGSKQVYL